MTCYSGKQPLDVMIRLLFILTLVCGLFTATAPTHAQSALPDPNWTRSQAFDAVLGFDSQAALRQLFQLTREGRDDELMMELQAIEANENLALPAREYLIHTFASGLGDLPAAAVGPEVLNYLMTYRPRTLVPHDDHEFAGIPLFNIPAAAAGATSLWARDEGWARARQLFAQGSQAWLDEYLDADAAQRRGFVDALEAAGGEQLLDLGYLAVDALPQEAALTVIAARSGLLLSDPDLFQRSVSRGDGPALAPALRAATVVFDANQLEAILRHTIEHANVHTASLALAELAPGVIEYETVASLLFDSLAHRELGPTAALVLGSSTDPEIQDRLAAIANGEPGLASWRATVAIASRGFVAHK
jgi:hypothetical protein